MQEGFTQVDALHHALAIRYPQTRRKFDYPSLIKSVVEEFAAEGQAVLGLGGSQVILQSWPEVFHVLIVAPLEIRIKVVMEQEGVSHRKAEKRLSQLDVARDSYYRAYFKPGLCRKNCLK
jgi:cytidylate kinase